MSKAKIAVIGIISAVLLVVAVVGLSLGTVRGSVVNPETGKPVTGAMVSVDGRTATMTAGRFRVRTAAGVRDISVEASGHEPLVRQVFVWPLFGANVGALELSNATLVLKVIENYPGGFEVRAPVTMVVGSETYRLPDQKQVTGLPIGTSTISLSAEGYEPNVVELSLSAGRNSVIATMTPSVEVMAARTSEALLDRDYELMWDLLHIDLKRQYRSGKGEYQKAQVQRDSAGGRIEYTDASVGEPEPVGTYTIPALGKTYSDVWAVPVDVTSRYYDSKSNKILTRVDGARMYFVKWRGAWTALGIEFNG